MSSSIVDQTNPDGQFRLLVQAVVDYAIITLDQTGTVTSWNAGAERAKGYLPSEILGRSFSQFFTPEDQAAGKPADTLAIALASGRFEEEGWRVRKDGSRFWASVVIHPMRDESGEFVGFAKITRDMTDKRAAQESLRESEHHFRLLMESVVDYAIVALDPKGMVTSWNAGAERAEGYVPSEILGRNFALFFTQEDQAAGKPADTLAIALASGRFEEEGWRVRKDGRKFWASMVIHPMRDENGQFVGFAKITRDMTEKRALEEAKEQLYRSQKLETVGSLTGGLAHDFNNLLSAVTGNLELISMCTDDDRIRRFVSVAERAATRGAKLTAQLLAFAGQQTLKPQTLNLNELIDEFESMLGRGGGERIDLRLDFARDLWPSDIDRAQFESALLNLVLNARDAMPKGGTLTIQTSNTTVDAEQAAHLGEISPGPYVVITVQDTGEGMTPEVRDRAIEPFYTTKEVGRGSGLGLSQVYGFVRQSNGQIAIDSEFGAGTSISIYLPRSTAGKAPGKPEGAWATRKSMMPARGSVLVVDDDLDVLETATEALKSFGYEVHSARDGHAALSILQHNPSVSLLFTDVIMPGGMNGIELAREACQRQPALRVLLASGYAREVLREDDGLDTDLPFIAKPYTFAALGERLKAASGMPLPMSAH